MKQMLKRFMGLMLVFVLVLSTSTIFVAASTKEVAVSEDVEQSLIENAAGIVEEMTTLDEETMEGLLQQNSPFLNSVVESWRMNQEELGAFVGTSNEVVTFDGENYNISMEVQFELKKADISIVVDSDFAPASLAINIQYPLSYKLQQAGLNTLMGITTVFIMLIALSGIISLFKYVNRPAKKKDDVVLEVSKQELVQEPAVEEELVDDLELVAVITAAIAASQNQSTDSFVVRSIKRAENKKWKRA